MFSFETWARAHALPLVRVQSGHDARITVPDLLADIIVTVSRV